MTLNMCISNKKQHILSFRNMREVLAAVALYFGWSTLLCMNTAIASDATLNIGMPMVPDARVSAEIKQLFKVNTKEDITLVDNQDAYINYLKLGLFDAFFAEPHLGAWAIHTHQYQAIAKLPKPLHLRLVAERGKIDVFELRDLVNRPICMQRNPALSYRFVASLFPDKEKQPEPFTVNAQLKTSNIVEQPCAAYVVNEEQYIRDQLKTTHITLARSQTFSQLGFFIRKGLPKKTKKNLEQAVLTLQPELGLPSLMHYFSNSRKMLPANNSDYPQAWVKWLPTSWTQTK